MTPCEAVGRCVASPGNRKVTCIRLPGGFSVVGIVTLKRAAAYEFKYVPTHPVAGLTWCTSALPTPYCSSTLADKQCHAARGPMNANSDSPATTTTAVPGRP